LLILDPLVIFIPIILIMLSLLIILVPSVFSILFLEMVYKVSFVLSCESVNDLHLFLAALHQLPLIRRVLLKLSTINSLAIKLILSLGHP
jgi:hypothetical protein